MQQQKQKKGSGAGWIIYVILGIFFVFDEDIIAIFLPFIIIGLIIYFVMKSAKKKAEAQKSAGQQPLRTSPPPIHAHSQQRPQPQRAVPQQQRPQPGRETSPPPRPQPQKVAPRPAPPRAMGVDYGKRHRENAKRMLDAGLITQEEYRMQIQRSHTL